MNARLEVVLADVGDERLRQERLLAEGKFKFTCADPRVVAEGKLPVLVEEVGEVAKAVTECHADESLYRELIQVAAVAVAWAQSLKRPEVPA